MFLINNFKAFCSRKRCITIFSICFASLLWFYTFRDGQGSLVCCSPWGRKELDTTEQLNNHNHSSDLLWWLPLLTYSLNILQLFPYVICQEVFFFLIVFKRFFFSSAVSYKHYFSICFAYFHLQSNFSIFFILFWAPHTDLRVFSIWCMMSFQNLIFFLYFFFIVKRIIMHEMRMFISMEKFLSISVKFTYSQVFF